VKELVPEADLKKPDPRVKSAEKKLIKDSELPDGGTIPDE
jgi:hypothetical protein